MQNNVILVIAVIVSLALGGGGAYIITSGQITTLTNEKTALQVNINTLQTQVTALSSEKNQLQNQVNSITTEKTTLQNQVSTLNAEKTNLQTQVGTLSSENTDLTTKYDSLVTTIDAMHSSNWTQSVSYNITAGTVKTQSFLLDKYGIVWDAVVDFSGTYVSMGHYYWYKGERFFVGSSGMSLTSVQDFRPTWGPQDFLYGTIKLDVSKDTHSSSRIWVSCTILTQLSDISRGGSAYFDII